MFVRNVFADYDDGAGIRQGRQTENQKRDLVSQRGGDIFGCDWMCEATIMGISGFSTIGKRGGNDKNTTFIDGNPDRNALLCNLKWTKSSSEHVWKFKKDRQFYILHSKFLPDKN